MLYKLIVYHTKKLINESLDDTQKLFHLRKRPKILLAQNYEQAVLYFDKVNTSKILFLVPKNSRIPETRISLVIINMLGMPMI